MNRADVIRAAVVVAGPGVFRTLPHLFEEPFGHLDDLRLIALALSRYEPKLRGEDKEVARRVCESFATVLEAPRVPVGGGALAAIIEHLSLALNDEIWRRDLWLRLAKNRKHFVRIRFVRLLQDGLLQSEADELWALFREKGDFEILRNLALANHSVRLPGEAVDDMEEVEGQGYLLSRLLSHFLYEKGTRGLRFYLRRFPVSTLYAAGFSGRRDLAPFIRRLFRQAGRTDDDRKAALWALARLGDRETVLGVAAQLLGT